MTAGQLTYFGSFRLDVANARLYRDSEPVSLTPKAFDVLAYLVENAGQLIGKDELLGAVWSDSLVTDASLVVCIREVRKALGDRARQPQFIETAHRRGYRFIAPVKQTHDDRSEDQRTVSAEPVPVPQRPTATLVGRDEQLGELRKHLHSAMSGQRQIVFLAGEAGVGKTSLVRAFVDGVGNDAVLIGEGQCFEHFGTGEPYFPILQALSELCRQPQGAPLVECLTRHAPTWLMQMPALQDRLAPRVLAREVLGAGPTRMLREMAETLEAVTAEVPLILFLEDLHWSDYSTLDLISFLANRQRPARLMLVGTYRPVEVILSEHALKPMKQELLSRQSCSEIPLTSLSREAVREYLQQRIGTEQITDSLVEKLHCRTDGHAFFLVNLVNYLESRDELLTTSDRPSPAWTGQPADADTAIPATIRAMIDKQIDQMDEGERELMEVASIAGREFSAAVVARIVQKDLADVEDCLDLLARQRSFLQSAGMGPWHDAAIAARYRFQHMLFQEAFYGRLSAAKRVRLHRKLAELIESGYDQPPPELAPELATHFALGHDHARAVDYLRVAAKLASGRYANREANEYLSRALDLARQDANLADQCLSLLEQRGLVHRSSNDIERAADDFESMASLAAERARYVDAANAQFYLASVYSWVDRKRCLAAGEKAIKISELLEDELQRRHSRGWAAYWNLIWRGWNDQDAISCEQAVDAAREHADRELLCLHAGRCSCFRIVQSDYLGACQAAEKGMELAVEIGDASEYLVSMVFRAWALLHLGNWGAMWDLLWDGMQIAERNGHSRYALLMRLQLAQLYVEAGESRAALELAQRSLTESVELGLGYGQMVSPILLGFAHLGLEENDQALHHFVQLRERLDGERLLMDWIWKMPLHYGMGLCYLSRNDHDSAGNEAVALARLAGGPADKHHLGLAKQLLAKVAHATGDQQTAEKEISAGLDLTAAAQVPLAERRVLAAAADVYAKSNPQLARQYLRDHTAVIDGLLSTINTGAIEGRLRSLYREN